MDGGGVEDPNGVVVNPVPLGYGGGAVDVNQINHDVCALCGDGGLLLCCEGPCLRSFHATREGDEHLGCATLGFTTAQVEAMEHFFCTNCMNRQHRCAVCGVLGSSDAANPQVFRCSRITCGRFTTRHASVCSFTLTVTWMLPDGEIELPLVCDLSVGNGIGGTTIYTR